MFSVEKRFKSREVLARAHMSSAERNETMYNDISSGKDMKRKNPLEEDIVLLQVQLSMVQKRRR